MKKAKTIGYYQKVNKTLRGKIKVYENTLMYLVTAKDSDEAIERLNEYVKLLQK